MRPGSTTEKRPAQSFLDKINTASLAISRGGMGTRKRITPHLAGSLAARAISPKSLSKVR